MGLHAPTDYAWQQLGRMLASKRVEQGVTQEFLYGWIGICRSSLQRIECGEVRGNAFHLPALELALGLPPGSSFQLLAEVQGIPLRPAGHRTLRCPAPGVPTAAELATETTLCGHTPRCVL